MSTIKKEFNDLLFVRLNKKVNPGTDCFCARLFPLSFFAIKSIFVLVLLHLWEMVCSQCEVSYPGTTSWMMVCFSQETWFQWFCKAECLCGDNDQLLSVVFTQILDHSVEDSIFVFVMLTNVGLWVGLQSKRNRDFLWKLFISSVSGQYHNFYKRNGFFVLCNSNFRSVVRMD